MVLVIVKFSKFHSECFRDLRRILLFQSSYDSRVKGWLIKTECLKTVQDRATVTTEC